MVRQVVLTTAALLSLSCSADRQPGGAETTFDGESAYQHLLAQCRLGPRVPNTEAHAKALELFRNYFGSLDVAIKERQFRVKDPYSADTLRLTNLMITFNPERNRRLLFCAHWDSRPRCEKDPDPARQVTPLPGANDGASGVAVLMQLAKHLANAGADRGVDLLLLDGEDWGESGDLDSYCFGSREFARTVDASRYEYAVVLDMVGDKDQIFYKEGYSVRYEPRLVDKVWQRAAQLGLSGQFVNQVMEPVHDDHVPLLASSLKAIDIIDFDYYWWHTSEDTPDKCSPESLARVGTLVLSLITDPL